jgi:hypothetical protein
MMAGTLAITGVGIVDVFGFAGFYSRTRSSKRPMALALALDTLPSSWASLRLF